MAAGNLSRMAWLVAQAPSLRSVVTDESVAPLLEDAEILAFSVRWVEGEIAVICQTRYSSEEAAGAALRAAEGLPFEQVATALLRGDRLSLIWTFTQEEISLMLRSASQ